MKHPIWFTIEISVVLLLLLQLFIFAEVYMTVIQTLPGIMIGFSCLGLIAIVLLVLYRFGYLLAGWKTTILDNPPPITWSVEDEKSGTKNTDVLKDTRHLYDNFKIK